MYIKRSGRNALLIGALILTLMMTSCGGLQDWIYDKLPNGYEIWRVNSQDIGLCKRKGDSSILVHNVCGVNNTPDQDAVIKLAKEFKNGISRTDANTLVGWAKEYGLNYHYPTVHAGRSGIWSTVEHIKIFNIHIPVVK